MGWFWGSNDDDPVKKLDPGLRDYLEKEAPKKYDTPLQTAEKQSEPAKPTPSVQNDSTTPSVPSASQFPDGRYAHLWKTYKPGEQDLQSSAVERMADELKHRAGMIRRAARENCALEEEAKMNCTKTGTWSERMISRATGCNQANTGYSRCLDNQIKFLRAVGYASSIEWDDEKEERIQMHADKLYHEMLDYKKRVAEAREAGEEPPPLTSLFAPEAKPVERTDPEQLEIPGPIGIPEGFKSLEHKSPHEREVEVRAYYARIEQFTDQQKAFALGPGVLTPKPVDDDTNKGAEEKRREKAVKWFGETIGHWIT
ncbi:hypothetical protein BDW59DRAFT_149358 [Aspergillus cavernicola]|uniref:Uncharacterized protein n=1 Tax=Aspergillus cavernicola TaxID=176166 RepID=A0ABR4I4M4_9EURO